MKKLARLGIYCMSGGALFCAGLAGKTSLINEAALSIKTGNYEKARRYLKPLAVLGSRQAQRDLALLYAMGWGVERNETRALQLFMESSARVGNDENVVASDLLGVAQLYEWKKDYPEYSKWLKKAAELGSPRAIDSIIHAYELGEKGFDKDAVQAKYWRGRVKTAPYDSR